MIGKILPVAAILLMPALDCALADEFTIDLIPVADSYVSEQFPGQNFNTDDRIWIRAEMNGLAAQGFLRFNLAAIPAGALILEARLTMTAFSGFAWGGDGTVYTFFVANDTWDESTITWINRPQELPEVLGHWWLWYNSSDYLQIGTFSTAALAARVQAEADGDDLISLRLRSPGYDTEYRPREHLETTQRPRLTVRYTEAPTAANRSTWGALKSGYR